MVNLGRKPAGCTRKGRSRLFKNLFGIRQIRVGRDERQNLVRRQHRLILRDPLRSLPRSRTSQAFPAVIDSLPGLVVRVLSHSKK
jgi:hypothetical protein